MHRGHLAHSNMHAPKQRHACMTRWGKPNGVFLVEAREFGCESTTSQSTQCETFLSQSQHSCSPALGLSTQKMCCRSDTSRVSPPCVTARVRVASTCMHLYMRVGMHPTWAPNWLDQFTRPPTQPCTLALPQLLWSTHPSRFSKLAHRDPL
jgi:hypothetical protein